MTLRIAVCGVQVPFVRGGAEVLYRSLCEELEQRGHRVELVRIPFSWRTRESLLQSALAWRLLDLEEVAGERIDLVIATRFPSYVVRHPRKMVWLIHQFRQIYDLAGTRFSDFGNRPEDGSVMELLKEMDRRTLGEASKRFAISRNVAQRLEQHCGLQADVLYPPPPLAPLLKPGPFGQEVLTVGRLDPMKRFDLLIRARSLAREPWRVVIVGEGPERERLHQLAAELRVAEAVELPGRLPDVELAARYNRALAVFYAPFDEDYGYVTVEAFLAGRPVVTVADAGGVLEFVEEGKTGLVVDRPDPKRIANALDRLAADRNMAARLGMEGSQRVQGIGWDPILEAFLEGIT